MNEREGGFAARNLILTFLAGALVGTAGVVMLSPAVRRETAGRARSFSRELKRRATVTFDAARDRVAIAIASGQDPSAHAD